MLAEVLLSPLMMKMLVYSTRLTATAAMLGVILRAWLRHIPRVLRLNRIYFQVSVKEMPSDAAKRRQQQKRDKRQAAEKKRAAKENSAASKPELKDPPSNEPETTEDATSKPDPRVVDVRQDAGAVRISPRSCTGVLTSHPLLRDVHIEKVNLTFHGADLLCDARLELNAGRKYGLVGLNGSGEETRTSKRMHTSLAHVVHSYILFL